MTTAADYVLPDQNLDLLDSHAVGHLATLRPDGELQCNPVWFAWDGAHLKISQTRGRQKLRNLEQHPHVALSVTDPANPYRYIEVRGVVERIEDDPEGELADELSEKYLEQRPYPGKQPGEERVVVWIRPVGGSAQIG